ncbi:hypothetical protein ABW21_db0201281 [Orbilia brochopaga]|nr:hypothetical protein ABW21_db0201281 [Drechslerella brochopaga]
MAHRTQYRSSRPVGTTYVRASRSKPSLLDRLTGRRRVVHTTARATKPRRERRRRGHHSSSRYAHSEPVYVTAAPAHHYRRKPTLGDKISGIIMRIRGTLTGRPGLKAAGARRQHGTDGRGSRRSRHY